MFVLYGRAVDDRAIAVAQTKKAIEALERSDASLYLNRIALADRYRQAHDADRADELLDDCPVALRDWEWRYLKRRHFEDVTVYPDHDGPVASVALSRRRPLSRLRRFQPGPSTSATARRAASASCRPSRTATRRSRSAPMGSGWPSAAIAGPIDAGVIELWSTKTWSEVKSLSFEGSDAPCPGVQPRQPPARRGS